jgi:topoisomerase IA-like protein
MRGSSRAHGGRVHQREEVSITSSFIPGREGDHLMTDTKTKSMPMAAAKAPAKKSPAKKKAAKKSTAKAASAKKAPAKKSPAKKKAAKKK